MPSAQKMLSKWRMQLLTPLLRSPPGSKPYSTKIYHPFQGPQALCSHAPAHLPKLIFFALPLTHFAAACLPPLLFLKQASGCHRAFALASSSARMLFFLQTFLGFIPSLHTGLS